MERKHIKSIAIKNFKCFDNFEADNFAQFNIIVGDNNVGKSSFLESLLFEGNISQTIQNLQGALHFKNFPITSTLNPFSLFINKKNNEGLIRVDIEYTDNSNFSGVYEQIKVEALDAETRNILPLYFNTLKIDKEILKVTMGNDVQYRKYNVSENYESYENFLPYLYSSAYYDKDLVNFYIENFTESRERKLELINQLKIFIDNISEIELTIGSSDKSQAMLGIWQDNIPSLLPLPMFGDGLVRLFRIIMEITVSQNKYLCIDEIDTGIHHSNYKNFAKAVLQTALSNNVQLFITTHNIEFLKALKEVMEEDSSLVQQQQQLKCYALKKLPQGSIKAYSYNFDEFEFAVEQENELR